MQKVKTIVIKDLIILTLGLIIFYFTLLGARPLFVPDEGRYAEIAREMFFAQDYITPYLNGIKYFEKPAMFYWLSVLAFKLAGVNVWSLRSINALLAIFGCIATYITAYQLYNRRTAMLATIILSTSLLYFVMSHMVNLDLTVTVFLTLTLYTFILGIKNNNNIYFLLAAAFAAFAVLTKGLIGLVLPGLIIMTWLIVHRKLKVINKKNFLACLMLFLLITLPWHVLVGAKNPEFYYFYFIKQHFLRYTTDDVGHYQPVWFFIPVLIAGFFPWISFLPQTLRRMHWHEYNNYFALWAFIIFVFFSFSHSKLIPYILPVFPALSILVGHYLAQSKERPLVFSAGIYFLLAISFAWLMIYFVNTTPLPNPALAKRFLYLGAGILLFSGALTFFLFLRRKNTIALGTITASIVALLLLIFAAFTAIDTRTIAPLAMTLKPLLTDKDVVISYNQYYQDLPFYLNQTIKIVNWRNELRYGMQYQSNAHEWLIDNNTFWTLWQSEQRVFAIMANDEYQKLQQQLTPKKMHLLAHTMNNVLICNQSVAKSNILTSSIRNH